MLVQQMLLAKRAKELLTKNSRELAYRVVEVGVRRSQYIRGLWEKAVPWLNPDILSIKE